MIRVTICYGKPTDPAAFDSHYAQVHVPLTREIPGLAAFTGGHCRTPDGSEPPHYYIAYLDYATEADFKAAQASPQLAKAGADAMSIATGGISVLIQQNDDLLAV